MNSPSLALLTLTFKALDIELPEAVTKAFKDRDTITAAGADFRTPSHEEITRAVASCILAGTDPTKDKKVQHLTATRALAASGSLDYGLRKEADRLIAAALTSNADEVVASLKELVDAAGKVLADAHEILGDLELTDSGKVLDLGPRAATAWVAAKAAIQTIQDGSAAWSSLAEVTRFASPGIHPVLRIAALDLDTFERVGRIADSWALVRSGATISLATRATAAERTRNHAQAIQDRQDYNAGAVSREFRRTHSLNG